METLKLYEIAENNGIQIDHYPLPQNHSLCIKLGNRFFIALDSATSTEAQERVRLAHELGHCETMGFYNCYAPLSIRSKQEKKADRWAIEALIPKESYLSAIKNGYNDIYSLAEFFGVTEDFMSKVVKHYSPAV